MNSLGWELIQGFALVVAKGSVSAAAREMGVSQPTLSRQLRTLEQRIGVSLFQRTTQGMLPTEQALALLEPAMAMGDGADSFLRRAGGMSAELNGEVRISASELVGCYLLPPLLTAFRSEHPGVDVEVLITNRVSSLNKRESDIALRMYRPQQGDLVVSRLPDIELGLYAHRDYLASHPPPRQASALAEHTVVGFDEERSFIEVAAQLGFPLAREDFELRSDNLLLHLAMVRSAAGIGALHTGLARGYPELSPVLPELPLPSLEFWCVCHRDLRANARVRALMRFIGDWFQGDPYRRALY